ncbi:MAG: tetratricopeptide repeat protein, partial [Flavobacteriales bacterium]
YMNKAIAKNPKRPNAHFMKSLSFMRQEKSKESKDELVKELKVNPNNTKAWIMIGKIWYNEKDREKACESWIKAQALKSEEATTLLNTYCGK